MQNREKNCHARRHSDQMQCGQCGLAWDVNDPEPPQCPRHQLAREAIVETRNLLDLGLRRTHLLSLREFPLNWLPAHGISEGLFEVSWDSQPEFGYVAVSVAHEPMKQGRNYLFFSKTGGPLVEVQVREDFTGRIVNRRDAMGPVPGEWVSA